MQIRIWIAAVLALAACSAVALAKTGTDSAGKHAAEAAFATPKREKQL